MEIELIETSRIVEDEDQPRKHYDPESLRGLADSIKQHGVLQPITVKPLANVNMYMIITGERRWRAAQMANLDVMPCIVKDVEPDEVLTQQLIENLQREDLQPLEKARALNIVKTKLESTNREIASRLGISERTVGHLLDLLELPENIGEQIVSSPNRPSDGQLTEKHARFLKQLNDEPDLQNALVEKIRNEKITSDHTGKLVKALKNRPDRREEIMASPMDHLIEFFRGIETPKNSDDTAKDPEKIHPEVQEIKEMTEVLNNIHPMDMHPNDVRRLQDVLTSLKLVVDGLLRECSLELENHS